LGDDHLVTHGRFVLYQAVVGLVGSCLAVVAVTDYARESAEGRGATMFLRRLRPGWAMADIAEELPVGSTNLDGSDRFLAPGRAPNALLHIIWEMADKFRGTVRSRLATGI
jgi:hypothetical protein